jgi:hypothetical protein
MSDQREVTSERESSVGFTLQFVFLDDLVGIDSLFMLVVDTAPMLSRAEEVWTAHGILATEMEYFNALGPTQVASGRQDCFVDHYQHSAPHATLARTI